MSAVLERRYRLLLIAYPPEYLETHEEEIIGTLLEGAKPGQLRPTFGEGSSLLVTGLRLRVQMSAPGHTATDSIRLAALLLLASVLSDRLAGGSDVAPLTASVVVACSIVFVVTGAKRLAASLAMLGLVLSAIATHRSELWLPTWWYDGSSLLAVAFVLAAASIRPSPRREWPVWLALFAIVLPFLYRVFWIGSLDEYQIPSSIVELVLPVAVFTGVALLLHDPRPAIAAGIFGALHLVLPLRVGLVFRGIDLWSWTLVLALTAAALTASVVASRRQVADLALPPM